MLYFDYQSAKIKGQFIVLNKDVKIHIPYNIFEKYKDNLKNFKSTLTTRYNRVVSNLKSYFNLSNSEYNKYFGDLK